MTDVLVETKAVGMSYATADGQMSGILSGIDLRIEAGAQVALIGPSGSGKSTLLHILSGLIDPTEGMVHWPALGERGQLMPEKLQVVFQSPSLFPSLTVCDNIALPLLLAGRPAAPGFAPDDLLARFGLTDLAQSLPEELSGGQSQRIAMLRALSVCPHMILADEPTGQLDSTTAQAFLTEVIAVADAIGAAMVVATHDPAVAARMAQHWTIDHGTLFLGSNAGVAP